MGFTSVQCHVVQQTGKPANGTANGEPMKIARIYHFNSLHVCLLFHMEYMHGHVRHVLSKTDELLVHLVPNAEAMRTSIIHLILAVEVDA